jgi:anaerobic selenocysteine-containing dehydrogenase
LSTPSGRIELVRTAETRSPLPAVPDYVPPREAGKSTAGGGLTLLSPPEHSLMNSSFANMERQAKAAGEQTVWIHPDDAADRGIEDGDLVEVANARGAFAARAELTERTIPGTVAAHGLRWARPDDRRTLNDTTSQELTDAGAGATFYDTAVEIRVQNPAE